MSYQPPYTITTEILNRVAAISELIGRLTILTDRARTLRLRRINRIRTIHGSLAIEGNTLSESQITAILEGRRVIAPPREVQEAKNALAAYDRFQTWKPEKERDLLEAHQILMSGLIDEAGLYRQGGVGVMAGQHVIHMAPPASRVPQLMGELLDWLVRTECHPLIVSSIFHYEFEFIHPFADGNGRLGRMWQSLILTQWNRLFADFPVESLVFAHQSAYYLALEESTRQADSAPFITFMLGMILDTLNTVSSDTANELTPDATPDATPDVTPDVRLLTVLDGEMTRQKLREALGLSDDEHFRKAYLIPALEAGLIEMTIPDKPRSSRQKYRLTAKGRQVLATG
jgi:Fic family protein